MRIAHDEVNRLANRAFVPQCRGQRLVTCRVMEHEQRPSVQYRVEKMNRPSRQIRKRNSYEESTRELVTRPSAAYIPTCASFVLFCGRYFFLLPSALGCEIETQDCSSLFTLASSSEIRN